MKKLLAFAVFSLGAIFFDVPSVGAVSLKLAPLEYRTTLEKGQKQKGHIDISNPTTETLRVTTSVQGFRQINNEGSLEFFDDEQIKAGVLLDLDEFELGPREAIRMYFILDGSRLPTGDVYGGVFFTTAPATATAGVGQSVKLGTLLSVINGTPGARSGSVMSLSVPTINLGEAITGTYVFKNTGNPETETGFYPEVRVGLSPFGSIAKDKGNLVFAGRSRENSFSIKAPSFGFYKVSVGYGSSEHSRWIFVARPTILWGVGALVIVAAIMAVVLKRIRAHRHGPDFRAR